MTTMENGMVKDRNGSWEAPLPLRWDLKDLPRSRENAMKRLKSTARTLHRKPTMREQYFGFMQNIFDNDHAEKIPEEDMKPEKTVLVPTALRGLSSKKARQDPRRVRLGC